MVVTTGAVGGTTSTTTTATAGTATTASASAAGSLMAPPAPPTPPRGAPPAQVAFRPGDLAALGNAIAAGFAAAPPPAGAAGGAPAAAAAGGGAAAAHGVRKIPLFAESSDPIEWRTWADRFRMIVNIAGWPDLRARQELYASMSGTAARVVADIPCENPGVHPWTITEMLVAYEARFVTQEASDSARAEFIRAHQLPGESLLEWHAKCRDLYLRAYPGAAVDVDPGGQMLRDRFIAGLEIAAIKEYTYDKRPVTYLECLTACQAKQATLTLMATKSHPAKGVNAVGPSADSERNATASKGCFFCGSLEHFQRQCPTLDKARKVLDKGNRGGGGRGRGGGGRGRGGGGRGSGNRGRGGKKQINQMGGEEAGNSDSEDPPPAGN